MNEQQASLIPSDVLEDMIAVAEARLAQRPLDPAVTRRIQQRSQKVKADLLRKYGVREIAVDLVRLGRDE